MGKFQKKKLTLKQLEKEINRYCRSVNEKIEENRKNRHVEFISEYFDEEESYNDNHHYYVSGYSIDRDDSYLYDMNKDDEEFEEKYYKKMR